MSLLSFWFVFWKYSTETVQAECVFWEFFSVPL